MVIVEIMTVNTASLQPKQIKPSVLDEVFFDDPSIMPLINESHNDDGPNIDDSSKSNICIYDIPSLEICFVDNTEDASETCQAHLTVFCCVILIAAETIVGYMSNSVACAMDVLRWLSDASGHYKLKDIGSVTFRHIECILLLLCVILVWCISGVELYTATKRLEYSFSVNLTYMAIAAALSLTTNCMVIYLHFRTVFKPRTYLALSDFVVVRIQQFAHIIGNHGTSLIVLTAAAVMNITPSLQLVDPITAFVLSVLVFSNTVSTAAKCFKHFRNNVGRRSSYSTI